MRIVVLYATATSTGTAAPIGWFAIAHGIDQTWTGIRTVWSGSFQDTACVQLMQKAGLSAMHAHLTNDGVSLLNIIGSASLICSSTTNTYFSLSNIALHPKNTYTKPTATKNYSQSSCQFTRDFINNNYKQKPYTKSSFQLGQKMHKSFKLGEPGFKEFRLPSGKRIDFLDPSGGVIYELKPHNPRAIRLGYSGWYGSKGLGGVGQSGQFE